MMALQRPAVLVCAGLDPSGGAGLAADIGAISAIGAHPLPVLTVLTAQDNDRVAAIEAVQPDWLLRQIEVLLAKIELAAIKIGIIGSRANAEVLLNAITRARSRWPHLPVILDPVLASGQGDALAQDDPVSIILPLLPVTSVILPNLPEAARLTGLTEPAQQAAWLLDKGCGAVLLKGGHGSDGQVTNRWFDAAGEQHWHWPRLPGAFHGSGCTLASALAAAMAMGRPDPALWAQHYTQTALAHAYPIAPGQWMPARITTWQQEN
jgi:hydroxymethylpyrimidine/phosphomethylpyrimidine kinase